MTCVNSIPDLWHYTTIDAAASILDSDILKATHFADFTDQTELLFGLSKLHEVVSSDSYITSDLNYNVESFFRNKAYLEKEDEHHNRPNGRDGIYEFYIISFTGIQNSDFHWNAFCKKNNSPIDSGCALGFNKDLIQNWISNELLSNPSIPKAHIESLNCLYPKDNGIDNQIQEKINSIIEELKQNPVYRDCFYDTDDLQTKKRNQIQIGLLLDNRFLRLATQIKRSIYQQESEYRIVIDNSEFESSINKKNNKQQIDLPMFLKETNLISKIIMSPNASVEDERTIQNAIDKNGLNILIQRN